MNESLKLYFISISYNCVSFKFQIIFLQIFVGGLKEDHTEEDIRQYFEEFGKIVAITRLTEKDTGKPRGFGYVCQNTGCPIWIKWILKSYSGFILGTRHFPHHFYGGIIYFIFSI